MVEQILTLIRIHSLDLVGMYVYPVFFVLFFSCCQRLQSMGKSTEMMEDLT